MAASTVTRRYTSKYLLHFAHEHLEFRLPELKSLTSLFGVKFEVPADYDEQSPFLVAELPSQDCARNIVQRAVLIRAAYELWAEGKSYAQLTANLKKLPTSFTEPYTGADVSFCLIVDTFNRKLTQREKITKIEQVLTASMPFSGPVRLHDPDHRFHILEFYGSQGSHPPDEPYNVYFGRWIADGQRDAIQNLHLQKRKFIGNTSMDAALSLLMSNMAMLQPNSFTFDPFVGSGSLLVAAGHVGSYVLGADIDYNIIHGRGRSSRRGQKWRCRQSDNIRASLAQYELADRYVDVLVGDSSKWQMWSGQCLFDAIVTDPPYGIREPTIKVDEKSRQNITEEQRATFVPRKISYQLADILRDLLNFSARCLTMGGRLVYWLPIYVPDYVEGDVPRHPCLSLVACSKQPLNATFARQLITMEKVKRYEADSCDEATVDDTLYLGSSFRDLYFTPNKPTEAKPGVVNGQTDDVSGDDQIDDQNSHTGCSSENR